MSEFFDAREYTTDAGDDSDLDSTEDEDIDEEDDEEEDEFLDDDNETIKRDNSVLETSSSRDDSDIVPVRNQLDSCLCRCTYIRNIVLYTDFPAITNITYCLKLRAMNI